MASEHVRLVDDCATLLARASGSTHGIAAALIHLIAERTKEATQTMLDERTNCEIYVARNTWSVMHAASALWPSHGTDGIEEKAK